VAGHATSGWPDTRPAGGRNGEDSGDHWKKGGVPGSATKGRLPSVLGRDRGRNPGSPGVRPGRAPRWLRHATKDGWTRDQEVAGATGNVRERAKVLGSLTRFVQQGRANQKEKENPEELWKG
jgi:hypothetical protein